MIQLPPPTVHGVGFALLCRRGLRRQRSRRHPALAIRSTADPERRFRTNFSTSRDNVPAVSVRLLAAVSTEAAAVSVSPMASRSEVMLATRVSLPWAADCALEEISRVAASCWPMAP